MTFATPVAPGSKDAKNGTITARLPGNVDFDILEPNSKNSELVKTGHKSVTQDEFIRVLIRGFEDQLTLA